MIRSGGALSDRQKAEMLERCPICAARPGRSCRNRAGRITFHNERLDAWLSSIARTGRTTPTPVSLWRVAAHPIGKPGKVTYLADLVNWTTARLSRSKADAVTFRKQLVAEGQAAAARRALGARWTVVVEEHR